MLNLDATDRRRLVVAAALTLIALPAIWLFARGETERGTSAPNLAAAGVDPLAADGAVAPDSAVDPFGTDGPIFVNGPTTPPKAVVVPVVVPAMQDTEHIDGLATYRTTEDPYATTCSTTNAPFNETLTVTNEDNGRSTQCLNTTLKVFADGIEIELSKFSFEKIGLIVDAPLHVRISWSP